MDRKKFLRLAAMIPMSYLAKPISPLVDLCEIPNVIYYRKGSVEYELLRKRFNKRIDKYPSVIAKCLSEKGIVEAVSLANSNKMSVAIKSGGHCMEGFSSNQGGMVIDLSELNQIKWIDENTIEVGPSCTLSRLYENILPKGKIIPGGSCAGVAIGGLALGGGYGLLSRTYGLTCDSLKGVTLINGKGERVIANENDPLLKACKGGNSGNFGVVSSMKFKVHVAPAFMQSYKFRTFKVTTERAFSLLKLWFIHVNKLPNHCFSAFVLNRKTAYILLTITGKQEKGIGTFIEAMKSASDKTTNTQKLPIQQALKNYYGRKEPLYFKNASAGLYTDFDDIASQLKAVIEKVGKTPGMIYQVNTLGGKVNDPIFNADAVFPYRAFNYFSELQVYWDRPQQEALSLKAFQEVQMLLNPAGKMPQYRNYPDINFVHATDVYYGEHLPFLKKIKRQHDPSDRFHYEQSIRL